MRPKDVGANPTQLVPGKHSGRRMPAWPRWVELEPGKDFTHFKELADRKKCSTMRTWKRWSRT